MQNVCVCAIAKETHTLLHAPVSRLLISKTSPVCTTRIYSLATHKNGLPSELRVPGPRVRPASGLAMSTGSRAPSSLNFRHTAAGGRNRGPSGGRKSLASNRSETTTTTKAASPTMELSEERPLSLFDRLTGGGGASSSVFVPDGYASSIPTAAIVGSADDEYLLLAAADAVPTGAAAAQGQQPRRKRQKPASQRQPVSNWAGAAHHPRASAPTAAATAGVQHPHQHNARRPMSPPMSGRRCRRQRLCGDGARAHAVGAASAAAWLERHPRQAAEHRRIRRPHGRRHRRVRIDRTEGRRSSESRVGAVWRRLGDGVRAAPGGGIARGAAGKGRAGGAAANARAVRPRRRHGAA